MRTKRVLRAAVAFLFAFGVLAADLTPLRLPPQTASAVTQADIDKLKKESNALAGKKSEVNRQLNALKKDKANTLKRKALLDQQIDLISEEIANTEQQIAQYEALIEQTEQELSETQAQEADQYELFCKRVTSPFGKRNTGIKGASTNHRGIDIGGVYYSSTVYAAKAGTVIISSSNSVRGQYIVISHGSGNTTTYQHLSKRSVSVGAVVKQGQAIGVTGSSGVGSGPHLHFEITENGQLVDPLKYLTDYVKAWN